MRTIMELNHARFAKNAEPFAEVTLPHTWNALDGQDGGTDYWRGKGTYEIDLPDPTPGLCQYIQFEGANHVADVFCNGQHIGTHKGGFSTFRFDLTGQMESTGNHLTVIVDNDSPAIYPQKADFTFFGGLYRPVSFVEVSPAHFDLLKDGTQGLFVTPNPNGLTQLDVFTVHSEGCTLCAELLDASGNIAARTVVPAAEHTTITLHVDAPHLWNGTADPYEYTATVRLEQNGETLDAVQTSYGYRSFSVDADKGFFLNGSSYPLHGVSRHQDRENMGWALTEKEHRQDVDIICEVGANAVRLAHYQHAQPFYDLCDQNGLVVWAEIPFISQFMEGEETHENLRSQLTELIAQNYNHPSICFWGISNEITMTGEYGNLEQTLNELNALAKQLDPSRLTTMAHLNTVEANHPHTKITDVQGFNVYKGWYIGEISDNGPYLDSLHTAMPTRPIGLSEYGADADVRWHSAKPRNHDYTEEYQALYHEGLLKIFSTRPYLWCNFVWNMFDFAADARSEGGVKGRNCKGLVTYDRTTRKDAFYIYQAYWAKEPMLHLCGKRFVNRAPAERNVKVYTNCTEVSLLVNGTPFQTLPAADHVCIFENIPLNPGENTVEAVSGSIRDVMALTGVEKHDASYDLPPEETLAGNWFDEATGETMTMEFPDGFLSMQDTIGEIITHPEADSVIVKMQTMMGRPVPEGMSEAELAQRAKMGMQAIKHLTMQQMIKLTGAKISPRDLILLNRQLNKIKKN